MNFIYPKYVIKYFRCAGLNSRVLDLLHPEGKSTQNKVRPFFSQLLLTKQKLTLGLSLLKAATCLLRCCCGLKWSPRTCIGYLNNMNHCHYVMHLHRLQGHFVAPRHRSAHVSSLSSTRFDEKPAKK